MGILNGDAFQIVYSDTPGIIQPQYALHKSMMRFVNGSLEDADVILFVTDIFEKYDEEDVLQKIQKVDIPVFVLINKIDLAKEDQVLEKVAYWQSYFPQENILPISALHNHNLDTVFDKILEKLPIHPPFYPKDELTDKPERFFAAEIIREKIFKNYKKEIPYACEVIITEFKEKEDILVIKSEILVERKSQRGILIGKGGESLKKIGIEARKDLEAFFDKKIFLEQFVKVEENWRRKEDKLKRFGYQN